MTRPNHFENLILCDHPLIADILAQLRDEKTPHFRFRTLLEEISLLIFYEAFRKAGTESQTIITPLEQMNGARIREEVLLVPILRAGLGMLNGITRLWPAARVGMIGMYRDESTLQPVDYYLKLPEKLGGNLVMLLDPMLATAGSARSSLDKLKSHGADRIVMLSVISAPEGVALLRDTHPDVPVYTAALDRRLNRNGYILPGLGDAGDRYFGV